MSEDPTSSDELELIRRVGRGDREAFSALYDLYSGILFATLLRILNDRTEAEDTLQEAFLLIWENAARFDPKLGKPFNWALTLARNKAIDRLRASQRRMRLLDEARTSEEPLAPTTPATGADCAHAGERSAAVRQAITALPREQREAIELAFFGGMTQDDIAGALREPLGTIKARIRRGMLKLRLALEDSL